MTDRVVHAGDLDGTRGLAEDGSKAYAKIDGVTIKFNAAGQMVAQVPTTTTAANDPTIPGVIDGDEWLVLTNGVITKQWVWDIETSSWYARPAGGSGSGADGKSAYEVAVSNGFVGTEGQWLASLVGAPGTNGSDATIAVTSTDASVTVTESTVGGVKTYDLSVAKPTGVDVYFDGTNPASASIFDTANPPTSNDAALQNVTTNQYYGTDGSVWIWNGTAYVTKTFAFQGASDEFTAAANQTTFVLTGTPVGKVWFFRNGARLPNGSFSVIGNTVTYIPANNGSAILGAMVAGDIVDIDYVK